MRQRLEQVAHFAHRAAAALHFRQHLQRRQQPVAGGREIRQHDMARLLAADVIAVPPHMLDHIAVAHPGADQRQFLGVKIAFEPEVRHDRGHKSAAFKFAALGPGGSDQRHELVAIDHLSLVVGDDDAVGVAVQGYADVGAQFLDLGAHGVGMRRAAFFVDVAAVGLVADLDDFGAQLPQGGGRHFIGGAIGGIDHHAKPIERHVFRVSALGEFDIARLRVLDALGAADGFG